ncbi:ATP-binding cassette domain-containing protein [Actinacidiphila epipremni]|uniref:ATP-binding cassette domain-containing protein n=1 Tax=Actinacidiphila epipremni TaxID=2053013 RepID=UPI0038993FF2
MPPPPPPPACLRLDAVGRRYGLRGPWVLRSVTLDVPPGSLVRVEGANGSGKSTLLRLIAGIDRPTAGRVTGRPAATAYVPERFPAALPFPALRYLTHLGAVRGLPAAAARERAGYWLDRFGIAGYARTPLDELSKGTCQKVAVAQALLADPQLLVLDEAWTGLDTAARATLDAAVRARVAAGATVVLVDHDPARLADEQALTVTVPTTAEGVLTSRTTPTPAMVPTRPAPAPAHRASDPAGAAPVVPPGRTVPAPVPARAPADPAPARAASPAAAAAPAGDVPPQAADHAAGSVPPGAAAPGGVPPGEILIEATGAGEPPEAVRPYAVASSAAGLRLHVPAAGSDAVLRALLGAVPPWHVTAVRPRAPAVAAPPAPPPYTQVRTRRRALALLRYQADLLARSHRWLAPLLGYGAVMAVGVATGQPLLGSLGYAAALLLPVTAWMVRVCVGSEPAAARACTASAVGPGRAQAGALMTGLLAAAVLGAAGTAVVAAASGAYADDMSTAVPVGPATLAGLLAAAVSLLLGTAVGALTNPPLVPGRGWSLLVTALGAGAVLLVSGSPAQAAVTGLVTGSRTGAVHYPLLPLGPAALAAAAACWLSCRAVARLGPR